MSARLALVIGLMFPSLAFADDAKLDNAPILLAQLDAGPGSAALAPADTGSSSGSAATTPDAPKPPEISDVGVMQKLWKNGSFFGFGILAVYLGLFAWWKLDKKHAFYAATALGGLAVLVESIRKGDTPSATMALSTLLPTVGIMITGPGHTKAPTG